MTRNIINVKPIKDKQVMLDFLTEMKKGKHGKRDHLIFVIGIYTGLRISDILNLKVSDVQNKTTAIIVEKKTNKQRELNLSNLTSLIIDYLNSYHDGQSNWLFYRPSNHSKPLGTKVLQRVANVLELDYIGTHTMRKTFGYKYYRQFKDIPTLMKILNHSSQAITIRYIGLEEEEIQASLDKFNPLN
ncbi:tyrosine-type recombinase/integrase [Enterococcus faecalis]|uniref:tyrosine-type recombinase/integrase n=1 Tax=Enterococcus faecalis TaxID=1351 RepID=UPI0023EABF80|nr:tyrosine-type recombinase/integrase [Enterococcus faecalis]WEU29169.1 tyrosine-type recombinase/integrase [Enterococcus faecalis]WEU31480.1 tyrosine-type recombinase/integrase [Enterococcus faecalis]